jgi:hypothetical protein
MGIQMIRFILLSLLLLVQAEVSLAQSRYLVNPEEVRKTVEGVVASLAAGNPAGALKELRPLSIIPPAEFDVFEAQFNSQQINLLRQLGSPIGYEFLREERTGTHFIRYQFIVLHEKSALRWSFVAYKTEKGWCLTHFIFDANAMAFFGPSAG